MVFPCFPWTLLTLQILVAMWHGTPSSGRVTPGREVQQQKVGFVGKTSHLNWKDWSMTGPRCFEPYQYLQYISHNKGNCRESELWDCKWIVMSSLSFGEHDWLLGGSLMEHAQSQSLFYSHIFEISPRKWWQRPYKIDSEDVSEMSLSDGFLNELTVPCAVLVPISGMVERLIFRQPLPAVQLSVKAFQHQNTERWMNMRQKTVTFKSKAFNQPADLLNFWNTTALSDGEPLWKTFVTPRHGPWGRRFCVDESPCRHRNSWSVFGWPVMIRYG